MKEAILVLEDGEVFKGHSFGCEQEIFGEVVFNTSMTGYQEILTDPSYAGQMVCMTYPLMGNYGINKVDVEADRPWLRALIVKKECNHPSNFRSEMKLHDYLAENKITGIAGIDTRRLTRHIREKGAMRAGISTETLDPKLLLEKVKNSPHLEEEDLVDLVSTPKKFEWTTENFQTDQWPLLSESPELKNKTIAVIDFGCKKNILRLLKLYFEKIVVFPASTTKEEVMACNPDGLFLSNGPGDPQNVKNGVELVKSLLGEKPIFGICLGHQLLCLSLGANTYKLKFGHRGANHPIQCSYREEIEITAQNHSFNVDPNSLDQCSYPVEITHTNLNDHTVAGIKVPQIKAFSVQYHPEASPGPHDSRYLFQEFANMID